MNQTSTLPSTGDVIDERYRIERKLGEGGSSTVYEVVHIVTDKRFAMKWLRPELAQDEAAVGRFIIEARVGGRFMHPNAVEVYDICEANDSFYILMELLEGESLQTRLERVGTFSIEEACAILLPCANVLTAAHQAGILHRDLKPANIFLCKLDAHHAERPKLLDFGISKFCPGLTDLSLVTTAIGGVIGTPQYMAPEQMLGNPTDQRTDLYALATVLFELISGQPPYQADSYPDLLVKAAINGHAPRLNELADVSLQFAAVVARAMSRDAADRYASVDDFVQALLPHLSESSAAPYRRPIDPEVEREKERRARLIADRAASADAIDFPPRRRPSSTVIAGVAALLVLGVGLAAFRPWQPSAAAESARAAAAGPEVAVAGSLTAIEDASREAQVFTGQLPPEQGLVDGQAAPPSAAWRTKSHALESSKHAHHSAPAAAPGHEINHEASHAASHEAARDASRAVPASGTEVRRVDAPPSVSISRSDFGDGAGKVAPPRTAVSRRDF